MMKFKDSAAVDAVGAIASYLVTLPSAIIKVGQLINSSIKQRSKKGIGLSGKMSAYTPKYKAWKAKKGRQTSVRDLTFSGKMWASLTERDLGQGSVRLFFGGAEEQKKAMGNNEKTPFFGMTATEDAIFTKFVQTILKSIHL